MGVLRQLIQNLRQRINRPLQYYYDVCVRCGACIDACHFYAYSRDPAHIPAYRVMLAKRLTQGGNGSNDLVRWYQDLGMLDGRTVEELEKAMWECTGCRRCAVFCPFDLDTALMVFAGQIVVDGALEEVEAGIDELAGACNLLPDRLREALPSIRRRDAETAERLMDLLERLGETLSGIGRQRLVLLRKLRHIAEVTAL